MKIDNFIESELKVIASDNLDVSNDLEASQTKNINELLEDEKNKQNKQNNQKEKTNQDQEKEKR